MSWIVNANWDSQLVFFLKAVLEGCYNSMLVKMLHHVANYGAKWIASSLKTLFGIWSGPLALDMSSPLRSFRMPPSEIKNI